MKHRWLRVRHMPELKLESEVITVATLARAITKSGRGGRRRRARSEDSEEGGRRTRRRVSGGGASGGGASGGGASGGGASAAQPQDLIDDDNAEMQRAIHASLEVVDLTNDIVDLTQDDEENGEPAAAPVPRPNEDSEEEEQGEAAYAPPSHDRQPHQSIARVRILTREINEIKKTLHSFWQNKSDDEVRAMQPMYIGPEARTMISADVLAKPHLFQQMKDKELETRAQLGAKTAVLQKLFNNFVRAAAENDLQTINRLTDAGVQPNCKNESGTPAVVAAARNGHVSAIVLLNNLGANLNEKVHVLGTRDNGTNALIEATKGNHIDCVTELLRWAHPSLADGGLLSDATDSRRNTALHWAARCGWVECARLLVDADKRLRRPALFSTNSSGWEPLGVAKKAAMIEQGVRRIWEEACNADKPEVALDPHFYTPMTHPVLAKDGFVYQREKIEKFWQIQRTGGIVERSISTNNPMTTYVAPGRPYGDELVLTPVEDEMRAYREWMDDPEKPRCNQHSDRVVALLQVAMVYVAITRKNVNDLDHWTGIVASTSEWDGTPMLVIAAGSTIPYTAGVRLLLSKGADANAADKNGKTALMAAVHRGNIIGGEGQQCVTELLNAGANPDALDNRGDTALHIAARHGRDRCIAMLLQAGANQTIRNKRGQTPLEVAQQSSSSRKAETVAALRQESNEAFFNGLERRLAEDMAEISDHLDDY